MSAGAGAVNDAAHPAGPPPAWGPSLARWLWLGPVLLSMLLPFAWMVAVSLAPGAGGSFVRALAGPWDLGPYRTLFAAHFPSDASARCVPGGPSIACSTPTAVLWDAAFARNADPSGRSVLGVHGAS